MFYMILNSRWEANSLHSVLNKGKKNARKWKTLIVKIMRSGCPLPSGGPATAGDSGGSLSRGLFPRRALYS